MKTYKNPISTAMSEYQEDFRYNEEWWTERMGTGNNNEYLWIQFKNGDNITVQSDYFQYDGNTCLPRFRADEVAYISRYYGDGIETTTAEDIVVDTDRIILYKDGKEYYRYEMTEAEYKEMYARMADTEKDTDLTAWMLDYCRTFATSKMNNNTTTTEATNNTPSTMNANEVKTMQEIENQAYRLGERNWRRRNVWESSEASKAAKNNRDKLINKAYLNAAAKHLTAKAQTISGFLFVRPIHEAFCVALEYSSPAVGMSLKIASPFCVESFLNNPDQVLEKINA